MSGSLVLQSITCIPSPVGCLFACCPSNILAYLRYGSAQTIARAEIEIADQTFYLTQAQYTDTWPSSPSTDPIPPGTWQGSHWSANFEVTGLTPPGKIPKAQAGIEPRVCLSRGERLNQQANEAVLWCGSAETIVRAATSCSSNMLINRPHSIDTRPTGLSNYPVKPGSW